MSEKKQWPLDPGNFRYMVDQNNLYPCINKFDFCDAVIVKIFPLFAIVPTSTETNAPIEAKIFDLGVKNGTQAIALLGEDAGDIPGNRPATIHIAVVGEGHEDSDDRVRGDKLTKKIISMDPNKSILLVEERGLRYGNRNNYNKDYLNERELCPDQLSEIQRTACVAGYIFAYLANGSQKKRRRVMIMFGENHAKDLVECLEYIIEHATAFPCIRQRVRNYYMFSSFDPR
jgi:hypothetical protein